MRALVDVHAVHCRVMRLFKSWRFARTAPLLAIVSLLCLLCIGAFLSLLPTGPNVPAVLTKADSSQVSQETNRDQPPLEGSYLAVPPGETEEVDKQPVNADLLSVLLLLALSLGATGVWLLIINGRGQGALRSLGIDRRRWFVSALEARPFWGVFRL
jgi:hypothetical protein